MLFDYLSCTCVGFVPRPITLEFEKDLDPTRQLCPSSLHSVHRQFMADGRKSSAGIPYYKDFEAF